MAYRCPVCEARQADGEHLANHLAITAILGRADHADWLEDVAPEYGDMGPADLAATVTPHADRVEASDQSPDRPGRDDHTGDDQATESLSVGGAGALESGAGGASGTTGRELDAETQAVLEEARELTAAMRDGQAPTSDDRDRGESDEAATEESS